MGLKNLTSSYLLFLSFAHPFHFPRGRSPRFSFDVYFFYTLFYATFYTGVLSMALDMDYWE